MLCQTWCPMFSRCVSISLNDPVDRLPYYKSNFDRRRWLISQTKHVFFFSLARMTLKSRQQTMFFIHLTILMFKYISSSTWKWIKSISKTQPFFLLQNTIDETPVRSYMWHFNLNRIFDTDDKHRVYSINLYTATDVGILRAHAIDATEFFGNNTCVLLSHTFSKWFLFWATPLCVCVAVMRR